jgi:hypothetical protein
VNYNTFVVRIWSDGIENLHGNIEHLATHARRAFVDPDEIELFIKTHLVDPRLFLSDTEQEDREDSCNSDELEESR